MTSAERLEMLFDDRDTIGVVTQLLADAWEEGYRDAAAYFRRGKPTIGPSFGDNPYRAM